jgi:hypothetical protein
MRTYLLLAAIALVGLPQAAAQGAWVEDAQPKTANQNQMTEVAREVRLIEQDTLPLDPSLQSSSRPLTGLTPNTHAMASLATDSRDIDNGMKLYRFTLAPRESITTHLSSDLTNIVTQRFGLLSGPGFVPSAASKGQINRVNRLNRQQRTTKIEFHNEEDRPFPLLLIVYGQVGHPYKIEIARK